jgi:hypothetical protein
LAFIGHAEKCQALADAAPTELERARLLQLAQMWLEFAKTRRRILILEGKYKPHNAADDWAGGKRLMVLDSEE